MLKQPQHSSPKGESTFSPDVENMPKTFWERCYLYFRFGPAITSMALVLFGLGYVPGFITSLSLGWLAIYAMAFIVSGAILLMSLVPMLAICGHRWFLHREIHEWADHGFVRRRMPPKDVDPTRLIPIDEAAIQREFRAYLDRQWQ